MPPTPTTKDEASEPKLTLPTGHPEAAYVGPDQGFRDPAPTGAWSGEEKEAHDKQVKASEDERKAAEEHEHKVATEERRAAAEASS